MKREYKTPKALMIDFSYDEQVVAASVGNVATYGDPQEIGRCQQSSEFDCKYFWNDDFPGMCQAYPRSFQF